MKSPYLDVLVTSAIVVSLNKTRGIENALKETDFVHFLEFVTLLHSQLPWRPIY